MVPHDKIIEFGLLVLAHNPKKLGKTANWGIFDRFT